MEGIPDHPEGTNRMLVVGKNMATQQETIVVAKAIASIPRRRILKYLADGVASLSKLSKDLNIPIATASLHMKILEESGLVISHTVPGKRGQRRMYTRIYDIIVVYLPSNPAHKTQNNFTVQMPVGAFVDHEVIPPCGLAGINKVIGTLDSRVSFFEPNRYNAQLVWLSHGYLEYHFPNHIFGYGIPLSLQLSMEICSEAVPSSDEWPSDIFLDINGIRIGIWTSPSDFGGKRGMLTPDWWSDTASQYGWLKVWRVDEDGSYLDGIKISEVTIHDLQLSNQPNITVRIGIDDLAENKGGLNIFGAQFGNHAQDIIMQVNY